MPQYIAKTFEGLEPILAKELEALGATEIEILQRAVSFEGDQKLLYRANMSLRTALRILLPLAEGSVHNQQELYDLALSVPWSDWFSETKTIAVQAVVNQAPEFNNSTFVALKTKDAIADHFRDKKGARPYVDRDNPEVQIHVHVFRERVTLLLDSSGESLHRRGYRRGGHAAPMNEVLAAGIVLLSGWTGEGLLIDPMCGSGTQPIEAALIASGKAPNLKRASFGFQHWLNYESKYYDRAWLEARREEKPFEGTIMAYDIASGAVAEAKQNALNAGVEEDIVFSQGDFFEKNRTSAYDSGMLLMNPPYGERLERDNDMRQFYRQIGDRLKQHYKGFEAYLLSSNLEALRNLGLRPEEKIKLYNGALEAQLSLYKMY